MMIQTGEREDSDQLESRFDITKYGFGKLFNLLKDYFKLHGLKLQEINAKQDASSICELTLHVTGDDLVDNLAFERFIISVQGSYYAGRGFEGTFKCFLTQDTLRKIEEKVLNKAVEDMLTDEV